MVIAYLRVGTSNKELLEEQKNEIKRYASDHDMNVDKWVTDVTVGKRKMNVILRWYWIVCKKAIVWSCRIFPVWDELCRK